MMQDMIWPANDQSAEKSENPGIFDWQVEGLCVVKLLERKVEYCEAQKIYQCGTLGYKL
jgi:hypothetical protein